MDQNLHTCEGGSFSSKPKQTASAQMICPVPIDLQRLKTKKAVAKLQSSCAKIKRTTRRRLTAKANMSYKGIHNIWNDVLSDTIVDDRIKLSLCEIFQRRIQVTDRTSSVFT